jgi:hypothetical protein
MDMNRRDQSKTEYFICETCGRRTVHVRRDVLDEDYNALGKTPLWNCDECYQQKRDSRLDKDR